MKSFKDEDDTESVKTLNQFQQFLMMQIVAIQDSKKEQSFTEPDEEIMK